ncbi:hypothetical protein LXA43DRAFT_1064844 [Ganoderma leucocontextum]|nr:hypothetical protein LXA43DRAFT_1064844 [Ganoderma leucocontextum]
MPFPSKVQVFHPIICPAELWRIIWTMVKDDINDEAPADPLTVLSPTLYHYTPFDIATHHFPNEELRAAIHKKVQMIGAYGSSAEKVLGPEVYKHTCIFSAQAFITFMERRRVQDQAPQPPSTSFNINNTPLPLIRAAWVKTLDLTLTSPMLQNINLAETASVWTNFVHLEALTIAYNIRQPTPLQPYISIGPYLPPSLLVLHLRPYGEEECQAHPLPGWETYTHGPNKPFWKRDTWAAHISAFSTVPTIHIHFLQYVVFPPFNTKSATDTLQPWVKNIGQGSLSTIAVSVRPFSIRGHSVLQQQLEDIDDLEEAKAKGLLPSSAQDLEDFDEELGNYLYYDLKRQGGNWSVDMEGEKAKIWGKKFGQYSYYAGAYMDSNISWFDVDAY